jgi:hypothetical protein
MKEAALVITSLFILTIFGLLFSGELPSVHIEHALSHYDVCSMPQNRDLRECRQINGE